MISVQELSKFETEDPEQKADRDTVGRNHDSVIAHHAVNDPARKSRDKDQQHPEG